MKILPIIIICLMICNEKCLTQNYERETYKNTFGLKNSNISGYGFFYNRALTDDFRLQLMSLIFYYQRLVEVEEHTNLNYALGFEIQQDISKSDLFRFYFLAGLYYYYDDDLKTINKINKTLMLNNSINTGVGFAIEYYFKRFIFSAEVGYKFYQDKKKITENNNLTYPVKISETKIAGGLGVGFVF